MEKFNKLSKAEMKNVAGGVLLRFECDWQTDNGIEAHYYTSNTPENAQVVADGECSVLAWCLYVNECFQL